MKYDLLEKQNAFTRAEKLQSEGNRHSFAERLDQDVLRASLTAEKRLKSYASPAWSNELSIARKQVTWLSKRLSAFKTGLFPTEDSPGPPSSPEASAPPIPETSHECSLALRQAKEKVRNLVYISYQKRDEERKRRIRHLEESGSRADITTAKRLRRLKKAEDIKQLFNKLRDVRRSSSYRQGVTRIEIPLDPQADPTSCVDWQQIDVPTDILRHLQERNRQHFGQAHGTPFTVPPLVCGVRILWRRGGSFPDVERGV